MIRLKHWRGISATIYEENGQVFVDTGSLKRIEFHHNLQETLNMFINAGWVRVNTVAMKIKQMEDRFNKRINRGNRGYV